MSDSSPQTSQDAPWFHRLLIIIGFIIGCLWGAENYPHASPVVVFMIGCGGALLGAIALSVLFLGVVIFGVLYLMG